MSDQAGDTGSEAWFLAEMEKPQPDVAAVTAALEALRAAGQADAAESRAEMMQDALAEKGRLEDALALLELRAAWVASRPGATMQWQQEAFDVLGTSWESKTLIESAQSERIVSARESLRRLRLLKRLAEGVHVYDRTWGMGEVTKVDLFNRKAEVDFERKLGHSLSLPYAAETLQLIGPDHLLVWKKNRAAELRSLVSDQPAEVIRMYLRSFGPAPIAQIQQQLQAGIVETADWKRFWDAARKELKQDAHVHLPTARTEALRLLALAESHGNNWFAALGRERDLAVIVSRLEELADQKNPAPVADADRRILVDRFHYTVRGATKKQLGIRTRALLAGDRLKLPGIEDTLAKAREELFQPAMFLQALQQLPARASRGFLRFLADADAARLNNVLIGLLDKADIASLSEAISYLMENGQEEAVAAAYRKALATRQPTVEQLSWLSRSMDRIDGWSLGIYAPWVMMMIDQLEEPYNGDRLKAQNQMRERFARADWLRDVMANMDNQQRRNLILRAKDSSGWPALDRQVVLAQMVKLYPPLEELLRSRTEARETKQLMTSLRSYRERQIQLQRIIQIELPRVAQDIAIARSYGDLRENHEFKSAKEHQLVLMRKRDELDDMLRRVAPTDFKDAPTEAVGLATSVVIAYPDGRTERYHVLGEWDGDTTRSIISCTSRMAIALTGRRVGDEVTVPTETGTIVCRVAEVGPLPDDIRAYVASEPPTPTS